MALYWPEEHVALDIVDDPMRRPFEGDDSYTVLRVTCADLQDYDSYLKIATRLCKLLGREMPSLPDWDQRSRTLHSMLYKWDFEEDLMLGAREDGAQTDYADGLDDVEILAPSEEVGEYMRSRAETEGRHVRDVSVWEGPIPSGSYTEIGPTMRMSTPEFFFFRKANELPFLDAVNMGNELCGKYRTVLTQYDLGDGYDFLSRPRTTRSRLRRYLRGARGTKECKQAKRVLRHVIDEASSPMGTHLHMLLCLPASQGGYGLSHALASGAFEGEDSLMPSSNGPYLAYDLCWPKERVALQYTGATPPSKRALRALNAEDMRAVCVTDEDVEDPDRFDKIARKVAGLLGVQVPKPDDEKWLEARARLRRKLPMPTYACMRLTIDDISEHRP